MKKLFLILFLLLSATVLLCGGCLATHEYTGVVEGLNRGLLLHDPYYGHSNIFRQQRINRQLEDINRNLQMQNHILRWNDPVFFP